MTLHALSAHGKSGVGCTACHGGDPAQTDKLKAHSVSFLAKPDAQATLAVCGRCHTAQLDQFKTGRHFDARLKAPRLDCAECHGVHSIGHREESFTFTQFCAGCHGLEYLPALPKEFQDLLTMTDELRDEVNQAATKGRHLSDGEERGRRELRRMTGEIVHPTDRAGGVTRIPQILQQSAKLKARIQKTPTTK